VLVTSGGTTVGRFEPVVNALLALEFVRPGLLQLLVVCGTNDALRRRLAERAARSAMPLRVFGFVDYMADLMAVSDLVVAKAGGLTVSEALGRSLPLVLYHAIPGQEHMNALYVVRHGAAVMAHTPREAAVAVQRCLSDPAVFASMQDAANTLGHPDAASEIMARVVDPLLPSSAQNATGADAHER
jgi:processive 1,2-diacylglycerol beta-glucosyltransferase